MDISGGVVTNAVPGEAWAVVRADASALPSAERITVADAGDGTARIDAARGPAAVHGLHETIAFLADGATYHRQRPDLLKTSFKIYVLALAELQGLEIQ